MVIDLLKRLVAIPSVTGKEENIATFVFEELKRQGVNPKRKGDNVWVELGTGKTPRMLLNSHLDTVPPASEWSFPLYEPFEKDGKIYGLGSNDAKASVASMICAALEDWKETKGRKGTLVLALTCNEEAGCKGLETVVDDFLPIDGAIVGEPNGLQICVAQKGALIYHLCWKGKLSHAAHGSHDNAMQKAIEDLARLYDLKWEKNDPFLGESRVEITQVHAGERTNVIPGEVRASLDIRYAPVYEPDEILEKIGRIIRGEIDVYSDRRCAVHTSPESAIVRAAQRAKPGAPLVGSKTSSDWVFLKGVPAIKMGPGKTEVSHTADEYIEIDQLRMAVKVYRDTIREFFQWC